MDKIAIFTQNDTDLLSQKMKAEWKQQSDW